VSTTATLSVLLGNYPHSAALKQGTIPVPGVNCRFAESSPLYAAFARMVRTLEYDVCEMALATYFQARDAGVPITLLPVVMIGGTHHGSLTRLPSGPELTPRQLTGRRVGVRSYSQTTGLWVRGILREEYGIEASDITWVTTEEPHVAPYREPPYCERSTAATVADLVRGHQVDAAVLGPRAVGGQGEGLVPVIPDAASAARAWIERHGTIPANHVLVVRDEVLEHSFSAVRALYGALKAAIDATAGQRDVTTPAGRAVAAGWSKSLANCLEIAGRYAVEQELVSAPVDIGALEKTSVLFDG
jgi:4,5-dihydroxyphthalate decarboxylase